tara:strand:+ start:1585 stop:2583 length:999 start_codon:yes stop_codon:yes gene_type:complete
MERVKITDIYESLTERSKKFENTHGVLEISQSIDNKLKPKENLGFIDQYRKIIRGNKWHHSEDPNTNYEDLISRWDNSSKIYQQNGFKFFEYVNSGEGNLAELHQEAMTSETLRKRDGKGSRIGLDAFLDSHIRRLDGLVSGCYGEEESEDVVGLLASTIGLPYISAENELYIDIANYTKRVGTQLTQEVYNSLGEDDRDLTNKILRDYCKYSLKDFNDKFFRMSADEGGKQKKKNTLERINKERGVVIGQTYDLISKRGSGDDHAEFLTLVERINEMNYLNTNVEVKFSFKGAPGLFHHFVFEDARDLFPGIDDIYHRNFTLHNSKGGVLI